ncbi:winged helix-turn-helix transcriptional regulator [Saccharothrix variisporea]|uniref:HxlR family transcriptional regulator n=1 Tax=Saccharothrix variisporea TaxID=543527 RepID=A0A495X8A6_9PSEU|nr:helix-turn-helix domain-containing protein [Saccharothrix variisporea]RKT69809.1 HxlR family transcriptional regulator [Saccharothrix variisporea]
MAMTLDGPLADRDRWQATRCSIGKAMEVVGNRTSMLLLREAFYGTTRFHDFATRVGVTEASAAARLRELVDIGVFEKRPYQEPGQRTRHEYVLTDMGRDLLPAMLALMQWGDRHLQHDGAPLRVVDATGSPVRVQVRGEDNRALTAEDLTVQVNR